MDNIEIERKFLVTADDWRREARAIRIRQGYIASQKGLTVRVRQKGDKAFLTVKASRDRDSRYEFEYRIPAADADLMLQKLCTLPPIEKTRYEVDIDGHTWEIDVFEGQNAGLTVAEIELTSMDQAFTKPAWLGPDVTQDPRFFNAYLFQHPFRTWGVSYSDLLKQASTVSPNDA